MHHRRFFSDQLLLFGHFFRKSTGCVVFLTSSELQEEPIVRYSWRAELQAVWLVSLLCFTDRQMKCKFVRDYYLGFKHVGRTPKTGVSIAVYMFLESLS